MEDDGFCSLAARFPFELGPRRASPLAPSAEDEASAEALPSNASPSRPGTADVPLQAAATDGLSAGIALTSLEDMGLQGIILRGILQTLIPEVPESWPDFALPENFAPHCCVRSALRSLGRQKLQSHLGQDPQSQLLQELADATELSGCRGDVNRDVPEKSAISGKGWKFTASISMRLLLLADMAPAGCDASARGVVPAPSWKNLARQSTTPGSKSATPILQSKSCAKTELLPGASTASLPTASLGRSRICTQL